MDFIDAHIVAFAIVCDLGYESSILV
jgi:hypothetical protein